MKTRFIPQIPQLLTTLLALAVLTLGLPAKPTLKIAAAEEIIDDFKAWTTQTDWEKIEAFKSPHATRPVVDLILQLRALKAGGLDFDYTLLALANHDQAKTAVMDGKADLCAETVWSNDIDANQLILDRTAPIIRLGEFNKGVYVLPSNKLIQTASSLEELQKFRAVVVETWNNDLQTLQRMNLAGIDKTHTKKRLGAALQSKQADFVLMEFASTPDMSINLGGVKLIPIPNCKVPLAQSRSWIIAKNSPIHDVLAAAFDQGIAALRSSGTIEKAYTQSGFFHPKIQLWPQLF